MGRDASDTVVRLTQQQIVLPGGMFILYDHCRRLDPDLEISPSEWLQLVAQCWAEDHAEELQLGPLCGPKSPSKKRNLGLQGDCVIGTISSISSF